MTERTDISAARLPSAPSAALESEIARLRALLARAGIDPDHEDAPAARETGEGRDELISTHAALAASQAALRESNMRLQSIFAMDTVGVIFWRGDFRLSEANDAFLRMSGLTREEAVGMTWRTLTAPEFHATARTAVREVTRKGETGPYEKQFMRKDGSRWWGLFTGRRVGAEVMEIVLDITARHEALDALRESEERFRAIVEHARDYAIFITDARGRIRDWLPGAAAVFGWEADEVLGQSADMLYAKDDRHDGVPARELELARVRGSAPDVRWHVRRDGSPVFIHGSVTALRAADGTLRGFLKIGQDVTDRRAAEERLSESEAQLRRLNETLEAQVDARTAELRQVLTALRAQAHERSQAEDALRQAQKMEAVGQLTGGLAHDFNNLLAGIIGSLDMLEARIGQGRVHDLGRYTAAARGAADRAAALTHRLLAFSRRQTLDPKPLSLNALARGMTGMLRSTLGPSIELEIECAEHLWPILCDPNQLENVLLNLCINARDAMHGGGRLTIETANTELDDQAGRRLDLPPGPYVLLCVTDTGVGMPPEVVRRAFEPFFTTKPLGEGTGLGLSMVYGFARQSGGQAHIESQPGHGTRVDIYLPRHRGEPDAPAAHGARAASPPPAASGTVLVVDDEPTVRMLVADVLGEHGYATLEAADAAAGLKVLQSDARIDLLVTDVGLPGGMNGRQLADAARVGHPGLQVLFITGYAESAVIGQNALEPGMQVMTKPFPMEALAARVSEMIAAGKA